MTLTDYVLKYKKAVLAAIPLAFATAALWGFTDPGLETQIINTVTDVAALALVIGTTNE